jgi:hypothetical protein
LKLRKIRDAAPATVGQDQPVDLLAAIIATRAFFGGEGDKW